MSETTTTAPVEATTRRSRRRTIVLIVLALVVLVLAAVAWIGVRGLLARDHLEKAVPLASTLQRQILSGEADSAAETFEQLSDHASSAAALTGDPIWTAAEVVPWIGPNLRAVGELASVVEEVSDDALGPLTRLAGGIRLDDFKPVDGAIALQPLIDAQPTVGAATAAVTRAEERANEIDADATLEPVRAAVERLQGSVAEASLALSSVDRAMRLVPAMLGADGPRNYLLLFQNPAELRSAGGIPGALALLRTEGGRLELAQQASTVDFPRYPEPVLDLPFETTNLYGAVAGRFVQNATIMPQFPITGRIAQEMWKREFGVEVDGVLSVDPIALSYLLKATGPITLRSGDVLTAENAVQLLLVDVYARYEEPAEQDVFFAEAAASVFAAVSGGDLDPSALVTALSRAGDERRVLVWSAREEDQAVLTGTTLAGALPVSDRTTQRFGAFLNDATASKMGTYLEGGVELGQVTCREDERPFYRVAVTLTNALSPDAAPDLPDYVSSISASGVPKGVMELQVVVYGSPAMIPLGVAQDQQTVPFQPTTDSGHPVSAIVVQLQPGESTVLEFGFLGEDRFDGDLVAQVTPSVNEIETKSVAPSCESAIW